MIINFDDVKKDMDKSFESLKKNFSGLRTGRAHPSILEDIKVDAYGALTPLCQCGNVSVQEGRTLIVGVWDVSLIKSVEKAISKDGYNPMTDGQNIRVKIPELTEERRKDLQKSAGSMAENAKISIRNVRKEYMDIIKKEEKDGLSEDDARIESAKLQKLIDAMISSIDDILEKKEKEIMTV